MTHGTALLDRWRLDERRFDAPNWAAPLDLRAYLEHTRADATVRGLFPQAIAKLVRSRGGQAPDFVPFRSYPVRSFVELIYQSARALYPHEPPRLGVRKLASHCFDAFGTSIAGRVILEAVGRDPEALLRAAPHAHAASQSHGRLEVVASTEGACLVRDRCLYQFLDCFEVGIIESALTSCGRRGEVRVALDDLSSGLVLVSWT